MSLIVGLFFLTSTSTAFSGLRYIFIDLRAALHRARTAGWMMKTVMILNVSRLVYSPAPFNPRRCSDE